MQTHPVFVLTGAGIVYVLPARRNGPWAFKSRVADGEDEVVVVRGDSNKFRDELVTVGYLEVGVFQVPAVESRPSAGKAQPPAIMTSSLLDMGHAMEIILNAVDGPDGGPYAVPQIDGYTPHESKLLVADMAANYLAATGPGASGSRIHFPDGAPMALDVRIKGSRWDIPDPPLPFELPAWTGVNESTNTRW